MSQKILIIKPVVVGALTRRQISMCDATNSNGDLPLEVHENAMGLNLVFEITARRETGGVWDIRVSRNLDLSSSSWVSFSRTRSYPVHVLDQWLQPKSVTTEEEIKHPLFFGIELKPRPGKYSAEFATRIPMLVQLVFGKINIVKRDSDYSIDSDLDSNEYWKWIKLTWHN